MEGYRLLNLLDILGVKEESSIKEYLQTYSCPYNADVEDFLHNKSITFAQQGISSVWLVFTSFQNAWVLVGYFALANKYFHISTNELTNNQRRRICKFATYNKDLRKHVMSAPLIGQLGKNYTNGYNRLINGDELLKMACDKVRQAQRILSGRFVYLECENVPSLIDFYRRNGFVNFGERVLDKDEIDKNKGHSLIQLLKYLA